MYGAFAVFALTNTNSRVFNSDNAGPLEIKSKNKRRQVLRDIDELQSSLFSSKATPSFLTDYIMLLLHCNAL